MIDLEKLREKTWEAAHDPDLDLFDASVILKDSALAIAQAIDHIAQLEKDVSQHKGRADFWNARARVHRKARSKLVLQVRELEKDSGRLDWMVNEQVFMEYERDNYWLVFPDGSYQVSSHNSPRQAIDTAMESKHG